MPVNERPSLGLEEDQGPVRLADLTTGFSTPPPTQDQQRRMKEASEASGFISRQPNKKRVWRRRSAYTVGLNFKARPGMRELLQEVGGRLEIYDQVAVERALLALMEKEKMVDLLDKYHKLVSNEPHG